MGGLIQQDAETGRYSLGLGFLRLAWKAADRHSVRAVALPWLKELVDATVETALFALYDPARQEMMLAATVDSPHPIRQIRQIAKWLPVTAGATSLAILAFLPEAEQRAILARPLSALTPQTTTDRATLEHVLAQVRPQEYALTRGERTPGAVGFGAPIFGPAGRVIGSVRITQPEQRFRPEDARHTPNVSSAPHRRSLTTSAVPLHPTITVREDDLLHGDRHAELCRHLCQ